MVKVQVVGRDACGSDGTDSEKVKLVILVEDKAGFTHQLSVSSAMENMKKEIRAYLATLPDVKEIEV